jgi:transketolase
VDHRNPELEERCINTVRVLAADAVQKAKSGHPGTPMGTAPMGHVLWSEIMQYDPQHPDWPNRDRFILSAGHACMLQYSYLYLTGYPITLNDIKKFRQLNSITAGHPEYGLIPGIEATTGPLGQGFGNGVGMAIAGKFLAARYNRPGFTLFDYRIYAICSDGDLMEGVSSESASLAGQLALGNLIYLYDDNHITIEGSTSLAFDREDVCRRFEAYGWQVQEVADVNDLSALTLAIQAAQAETRRPSLIKVRTHIGYGSPHKVDTAEAHGSPLGEEELKAVKKNLGFNPEEYFFVPREVFQFYQGAGKRGIDRQKEWADRFANYQARYPELANEYLSLSEGRWPAEWQDKLPLFSGPEKMATRKASGAVLNSLAASIPTLIGGSADLAPSTDTLLNAYGSFSASDYSGRNFHFGVREHAMGAILNGMALTRGIIPYGGSFLIFSDYMRPSIRLAAIMQLRIILVYTHDSIGLGEDGTTHQPVEQLVSLRAIPGITVIRPADANETAQAWRVALLHRGGPVLLVLTRQGLPIIDQAKYTGARELEKGAYVLSPAETECEIILIGSGSEVQLLLKAQQNLKEKSIAASVVSMPSWELFDRQDIAYRESVLPAHIKKRLAVEAASPVGWDKYITDEGAVLGINRFGQSAPGDELMKAFGFTEDHVTGLALQLLGMPEAVLDPAPALP